MDSQKEYNQFLAKFLKSTQEVQNDFKRLSPENQQRFAQQVSAFLKGCGIAISVEMLMQNFGHGNDCIGNRM